ncbi:MAG TPA: M24 family metallopeptidase [Acidimicrobiia bacterium]
MTGHLDRVLAEMARADVDVMVLGREANARYVSGANRLFLAGTRAFAPGCAVVRATGAVHLLSVTDEGVPAEIPPERLYPLSWNPVNLVGAVAAAPGANGARRVGVDGLTPLFEQLLTAAFPESDLVDGEMLMRRVRRVKSPEDVAALRVAVGVVEDALGAAVEALRPGVTERELLGVFEEARCAGDAPVPAFQGVFCVVDGGRSRRFVGDRVVESGDLVAMRAGALVDGWEGSLARTYACGEGAAEHRARVRDWQTAWSTVTGALGPGARVGDLRAAEGVTVHGVGLGYEGLADDEVLEPGMVVEVEVERAGVVGADMFVLETGTAEPLTRFPGGAP